PGTFANANTGAFAPATGIMGERTGHPLLYNAVTSSTATPFHRVFTPAELELFYRYGDVGTSGMQSDLAALLSASILDVTQTKGHSITTLSFDRNAPGVVPYVPSLATAPNSTDRFQLTFD